MPSALLGRTAWVISNLKMNPETPAQAAALAQACAHTPTQGVRLAVVPSFLHLPTVQAALQSTALFAQDVAALASATGAYTGDVSAQQLAAGGVSGVLVGHSERRQYHHETEAARQAKIQAALAAGLTVVLCVGEQLAEREQGLAERVVLAQLQAQLSQVSSQDWLAKVLVAYEPVWAIGTGKTASPADAQAMHACIRAALVAHDPQLAQTPVLYGGSVKPDNAAALAACADIDGALVGGAALEAESFLKIAHAFAHAKRG